MRILVIGEHLRRLPSSPSRWVPAIAHALARRGLRVTCAMDGADDPDAFAPLRLLVHRPHRTYHGANPFPFRRWADDLQRSARFDAVLSLTRLVPARAWLPIGPTMTSFIVAMFRTQPIHSAAFELLHHPWVVHYALAEHLGRVGPPPARAAAPRLALGRHDPRVTDTIGLGVFSTLDPPDPDQQAALRDRVRASLAIPRDAILFFASGVHAERPGLAPMLAGLVHVAREAPSLMLLLAGRRTHTLRTAALAHLDADRVRVVGETPRTDALLSACDAAVAPFAASPGAGTGRFVADAIRMGRPVLADPRSPGAVLLSDHAALGGASPGGLAEGGTVLAWTAAFRDALDPRWRRERAAAALALAPSLSIDRLAERLDAVLRAEPGGDRLNPR